MGPAPDEPSAPGSRSSKPRRKTPSQPPADPKNAAREELTALKIEQAQHKLAQERAETAHRHLCELMDANHRRRRELVTLAAFFATGGVVLLVSAGVILFGGSED